MANVKKGGAGGVSLKEGDPPIGESVGKPLVTRAKAAAIAGAGFFRAWLRCRRRPW